jgi:hypothetical protein
MMNWTVITDRTAYEAQRYNFFLQAEERGIPKLKPYNDLALPVNNMTIGIGFNLNAAVRQEVLRAFGLIRNNPALLQAARNIENGFINQIERAIRNMDFSALDAIMLNRANNTTLNVPALVRHHDGSDG